MSSYLLEHIRDTQQQIEQLEKAIVIGLFQKMDNPKDSVIIDHKVKIMIDMVQSKSMDALLLINDFDGSKKEELQILAGTKSHKPENSKHPDVWKNFYDRISQIKEYHKKYLPQTSTTDKLDPKVIYDTIFQPPNKEPQFNAEEHSGKFVDLNPLFLEFSNLKKIKFSEEYKIGDYLWYLQNFDQFQDIPYNLKEKEYKKYRRYLQNLYNYLSDFFQRVQPLTDFQKKLEISFQVDFHELYSKGRIKGWENIVQEQTQDEIEKNPLYCAVCEKLFSNENTHINHFTGKKHKQNEKLKQKNLFTNGSSESNKKVNQGNEQIDKRGIAYLEYCIMRLREQLSDVINDTQNEIRKKLSRTLREREMENEDKENLDNDDNKNEASDEEDGPIYNPKNLPLGWDGKPIPYWLYKLHGLGIEYRCEICGNQSYFGRRAFEQHFHEWRHAYGMKCLKIPNTVHFKEITQINDALALHQKLQLESKLQRFDADRDEEFEDSMGTVLNRKTFQDLQRQGLL